MGKGGGGIEAGHGGLFFSRTYDFPGACPVRQAGRSEHTRRPHELGLGAPRDCVTGRPAIPPGRLAPRPRPHGPPPGRSRRMRGRDSRTAPRARGSRPSGPTSPRGRRRSVADVGLACDAQGANAAHAEAAGRGGGLEPNAEREWVGHEEEIERKFGPWAYDCPHVAGGRGHVACGSAKTCG